MINLNDITTYDLIDCYISTNIDKCNEVGYAYSLGRVQGHVITVLMKHAKAPQLLDENEKEQVPEFIKLFSHCNLDMKVFVMSDHELAELMKIDYYTIKSEVN